MGDPLFRLHHVGILVADVRRASESMAARFGYGVESPVIEDPLQTAFAIFLRLPDADHWTELVAPNGPDSKLSNALRRTKGGTHHVCYQVEDIEGACVRLREQSMLVIAEPVASVAFGGRPIAWLVDGAGMLVELVQSGPGPLCLPAIAR